MQGDSIREHLEEKSASIIGKWSQLVLETYPADTARFLRNEKDRFVNPVGYTVLRGAKEIFRELLDKMDPARLAAPLDEIIRIRSVQEFSPSQAVGVVFLLKEAVRAELAGKVTGDRGYAELLDFESRVDRLALMAFDIYMKCREEVCEIRINEVAAQREMALRILAAAGGTGDPA
jgi:hypothetical protein